MQSLNKLKPCPICGATAVVEHHVIDGLEFGWGIGCPRYCLKDGLHGHDENTPDKEHLFRCGFSTKQKAIEWWNRRTNNENFTG